MKQAKKAERRSTKQLRSIKNYVLHTKSHPTAEDVYKEVVKDIPDISLRTVYRNLNKLAEQGMLRKIQVPNAPDRYDSTLEVHQHIFCTKCGEFTDVYLHNEDRLLSELQDLCGYKVTGIDVVYSGKCPRC